MGGAVLGAQLFQADFTINHVFTNAGATGGYEWSGIFTPYAAARPARTHRHDRGPDVRRAALVADAEAREGEEGLQAHRPAEGRRRRPEGVRLDLYAGKKAKPAPNAVSGGTGKRVAASAKLPSSGKYTLARPNVKFATFFQTRIENYTTACTGPSPSGQPVPKGCREERIAAVTSNQLKVLKPKPKKKHRK